MLAVLLQFVAKYHVSPTIYCDFSIFVFIIAKMSIYIA
jgi:hypothetical protein